MRVFTLLLLFFCFNFSAFAQHTSNESLGQILTKKADSIQGKSGNWQFVYKQVPMLCVTDVQNNRMRIVAPIIEAERLDESLLLDCLTANFHSSLDVRYAIADGIVWSAFIHPLRELSDDQISDAIDQVASAVTTFGTTFSSTELLFGANTLTKSPKEKKETEDQLQKF